MTPEEWDAHEHAYCEACEHDKRGGRRCPVKATLHQDPTDEMALVVTSRLGRCSQYKYKQTKRKRG